MSEHVVRSLPCRWTQSTGLFWSYSSVPQAKIKGENMKIQSVLKCVVACAVGGLLLAGSASAQFKGQTLVANVEPGPSGQITAGTSAARCGNTVLVGFGDSDSSFK